MLAEFRLTKKFVSGDELRCGGGMDGEDDQAKLTDRLEAEEP